MHMYKTSTKTLHCHGLQGATLQVFMQGWWGVWIAKHVPVRKLHDRWFGMPCRFAQDKALMAAKESRKIVLLYNRVARALVEFEARAHCDPSRCVHPHNGPSLLVKNCAPGGLTINVALSDWTG